MKKFIILPRAKADLRTTAHYYDAQTPGRGKAFLADFEEVIARIVELPLASPVLFKGARKTPFQNFKFNIYYLIGAEKVIVFAVLHWRRHPDSWKKRL
ncbi:MAG TPA: type II toxin-antitoxin system RelE/ParE family toxin [Thermoanaerobaculia bacterium]